MDADTPAQNNIYYGTFNKNSSGSSRSAIAAARAAVAAAAAATAAAASDDAVAASSAAATANSATFFHFINLIKSHGNTMIQFP